MSVNLLDDFRPVLLGELGDESFKLWGEVAGRRFACFRIFGLACLFLSILLGSMCSVFIVPLFQTFTIFNDLVNESVGATLMFV